MNVLKIVERHGEEAAFLWVLRTSAVRSPRYSLHDLAEVDSRVEAHLDALRIAGTDGWRVCESALSAAEGGEVFAAAVLALEDGSRGRFERALDTGTRGREAARGLVSAFGWLSYAQVRRPIERLLRSAAPELRRIGIAAAAAQRVRPPAGLEDSLESADASLRATAARAAGRLGAVRLLPALRGGLSDDDDHCRFSAGCAAMLLGSPSAGGHTLRDLAERAGANREEAVTMAARGIGLPSANVWREKLAQRSDTRRLAVIAAGAIGDPSCVPWLIEQMSTPDLARSAFAAFTLLTGVNLEQSPVTGKGRTCNLGVTDDVASEDLPRDPDEGLPWPDPVRVEEWWHVHRSRFRSGHRYLAGISISRGSLASVLRHGLQPQRAAAAIELALERPGEPLFEVRAPGFRQLAAFGAR